MVDLGAQSHYSVLGLAPGATAAEIRASLSKVFGELERQRQKARSPEEERNLIERQMNLNKIGDLLTHSEKRASYDNINAHLTFFQIRKAVTPVWDERELLLRWMHRTVREFLITKGEMVQPISDLERTDFSADFTENDIVEGLLRAQAQEKRTS